MASTGTFIYPPTGQDLNFNVDDTIEVTWQSYATNTTPCALSTWVWSGPDNAPWNEISWQTTPCNGTMPIRLDRYGSDSFYLAQFNFNYTSESDGYVKYLTGLLNVNNIPSDSQSARTWSAPHSATGTATTVPNASAATGSAVSAIPTVATATQTWVSILTVSASSPTSTATDSADSSRTPSTSSNDNNLSTGSIVGIVIGAVIVTLLFNCALWLLVKRRRRHSREEDHRNPKIEDISPSQIPDDHSQYQRNYYEQRKEDPTRFMSELPGTNEKQQELVGSPVASEMPSPSKPAV